MFYYTVNSKVVELPEILSKTKTKTAQIKQQNNLYSGVMLSQWSLLGVFTQLGTEHMYSKRTYVQRHKNEPQILISMPKPENSTSSGYGISPSSQNLAFSISCVLYVPPVFRFICLLLGLQIRGQKDGLGIQRSGFNPQHHLKWSAGSTLKCTKLYFMEVRPNVTFPAYKPEKLSHKSFPHSNSLKDRTHSLRECSPLLSILDFTYSYLRDSLD